MLAACQGPDVGIRLPVHNIVVRQQHELRGGRWRQAARRLQAGAQLRICGGGQGGGRRRVSADGRVLACRASANAQLVCGAKTARGEGASCVFAPANKVGPRFGLAPHTPAQIAAAASSSAAPKSFIGPDQRGGSGHHVWARSLRQAGPLKVFAASICVARGAGTSGKPGRRSPMPGSLFTRPAGAGPATSAEAQLPSRLPNRQPPLHRLEVGDVRHVPRVWGAKMHLFGGPWPVRVRTTGAAHRRSLLRSGW